MPIIIANDGIDVGYTLNDLFALSAAFTDSFPNFTIAPTLAVIPTKERALPITFERLPKVFESEVTEDCACFIFL